MRRYVRESPPCIPREDFCEELGVSGISGAKARLVARVFKHCTLAWGLPDGFAAGVSVVFSRRLRRSLGRCALEAREIRLHQGLVQARGTLLEEVLTHELAHLVVHDRSSAHCRPHGTEWAALVQAAGYPARARLTVDDLDSLRLAGRGRPKIVYVHRCHVCHTERPAQKPMPRWRCASCRIAGLAGRLSVVSKPTGGPSR